jgi:hypothetical protein
VPNHDDGIDPATAAYWALVAVALVALGAILTGSPDSGGLSIAERGTVMGGIVAVLGYVAWRGRRRKHDGGDDQ